LPVRSGSWSNPSPSTVTGPRASSPFIPVNCGAFSDTLLQDELFGHERGAFTGAVAQRIGRLERAGAGTLFLDEIGELDAALQGRLLRVLQDREFERLGGTKTHKVDVRLVAATNRDLRAALEEGTFREDLYYRLNVVAIDIPPLRDHKEDIPALVNLFLERYAKESAKPVTAVTPKALIKLTEYHWPGNIRELQNIIERGVTLSSGTTLDTADIYLDDHAARPSSSSTPHVLPPGMTLEQWEDETIREALRRAHGNKSQAARALGLSRNALRYRLSKLGVPDPADTEN